MKVLILFLVLAISVQPLQAGLCDMEASQDASQTMEHSDDMNHGCCDSDDSGSQPECGSMMHCGFCSATFSTLPKTHDFNPSWVTRYSPGLSSNAVLPSHSSPPLRPPIA